MTLYGLSAADAVAALHAGTCSAEALVRACLDRIAADEARVEAWQYLDPAGALEQARRVDAMRPRPALGGLPVGVKDIIDTGDMPTECGSPIRRGRRPAADAACVAALRASGAVILGKTVTTEFAVYTPGKTRNPRDPARTPGGSSSGSAAAVAAAMVPVALGTQTAGSIIRPAAFCGVVGFKPTFDLLPTDGVFSLSRSLDTLGLFARSLDDLPLLSAAMGAAIAAPRRDVAPRIGVCRTEQWALATPEARTLLEEAAARLAAAGAQVTELELPAAFQGLPRAQETIMAVEAARSLAAEGSRDRLSEKLRALVAAGEAITPRAYEDALARAAACRRSFPSALGGVDALLTTSTPGEAPPGLDSTGDPAFNRIWTLLHVPCVHLPISSGPAGMPLGVQLVGRAGGDGALLAVAGWVHRRLAT